MLNDYRREKWAWAGAMVIGRCLVPIEILPFYPYHVIDKTLRDDYDSG
jgi:hypothetical protein